MKKHKLSVMSLLLVLSLFLAACNGGDDGESTSGDSQDPVTEENKEEVTDENEEEVVEEGPTEGGVATYAVESEFDGLFNFAFYDGSVDGDILSFFDENLIGVDDNLQYVPGIADWTTDDNINYTFTFQQGVKWHNGDELTVHDWVFSLETIAHPDYDGVRFVNVSDIVGAQEFRAGEADNISGLNVIDDYTIEITFDKARVNNLENLWTYPMNRAEFEGIEVKDMSGSPQVRQNPVGLGPFKVKKIVPGEYVEMERFDDYYQGRPYLDGIVVKVIDSSLTKGLLENGEVDMMGVHPSNLGEVEALNNIDLLEIPGLSYYYIGFKMGEWDGDKNVMNIEKYQDKKLRQAMLYAIDRQAWVDAFFSGLAQPVNRPVPSVHWIAAENAMLTNQFEYSPEKAMELLDEAGYVDVDGDGLRDNPDGEKFTVKFGHYATSNPTYEARAQAILQYWQDVGLDAQFATGGLIEVNLYYDMLENDDQELEVFYGGWYTGTDPDPSPLWGSDAKFNYTRWVDAENDRLLDDALDMEIVGTDTEKRMEIYKEWQQFFNEEVPVLPIMELYDLWAVNNRLQGTHINSVGAQNDVHLWYISE
ncbi:oligopeptide ABC transporter substrate-binding protein [Cytobacillus sp. Hm23]